MLATVLAQPLSAQQPLTDSTPVKDGEGRSGGGRSALDAGLVREGQAVLIAETSNSRVILSLTRTPPVSSVAFQVTP
jgi:hypothetical protein